MSQTGPSPKIQELAQGLLAYEAATNSSGKDRPDLFCACEKLRRPLSKVIGIGGFRSLLARALALATAEVPGLRAVQITPDGSLESSSDVGTHDQVAEAGVILMAQLLGLLVIFIGESLALKIVLDAWPGLPAFDTGEKDRSCPHKRK